MTDRRSGALLGLGALACVACCLWPFAIAALVAGAAGFLVSPGGWLAMVGVIALGVTTAVRRRQRSAPVPVELVAKPDPER